MGQPNPPGDIPLVEGLGTEWNDIISAIPEDRRAEFGPKIKERLSGYEPLRQWEDLQKSGITPDHVGTALNIYHVIENNPREVYETIGKHLGITPQQAKEVVKEVQEEVDSGNTSPELVALQNQVNILAQIALAQRETEQSASVAAQQDKLLEDEMTALKNRHGEFPEDEIIMRMLHKELSAEEAYNDYMSHVTEIQKRRPAPFVMGSGGAIPRQPLDVTKLTGPETKNVVAQMLGQANNERRS